MVDGIFFRSRHPPVVGFVVAIVVGMWMQRMVVVVGVVDGGVAVGHQGGRGTVQKVAVVQGGPLVALRGWAVGSDIMPAVQMASAIVVASRTGIWRVGSYAIS